MKTNYSDNVFINCPFDKKYKPLQYAAIFAVFACGFVPHCSLEIHDGGEMRLDNIIKIIAKCKFGIHDISRTELDHSKLPRANMPFELGVFLGAKKLGTKQQKQKILLIMDKKKYRYQAFLSDIAGQDIDAHSNSQKKIIEHIRNWLNSNSSRTTIPGGKEILKRFNLFKKELPNICQIAKIQENELTYNDYTDFVNEWLKTVALN